MYPFWFSSLQESWLPNLCQYPTGQILQWYCPMFQYLIKGEPGAV